MHLKWFLISAVRSATTGGRRYHLWMGVLTLFMLLGAYGYYVQLRDGLSVTGMNDHVSWGLYISNFTFLVGMAAAAVMLVLPAYVLEDVDFARGSRSRRCPCAWPSSWSTWATRSRRGT
jgi:cytosine/uracil/thiamine/allantoin permease